MRDLKTFVIRPVAILLFLFSISQELCSSPISLSDDRTNVDQSTVYVVIGVFQKEENAALFASEFQLEGVECNYAQRPLNQLFYVYIFNSGSKSTANVMLNYIREFEEFDDAWIFQPGPYESDLELASSEEKLPMSVLTASSSKEIPEVILEEQQPEEVAEPEMLSYKLLIKVTNQETESAVNTLVAMSRNSQSEDLTALSSNSVNLIPQIPGESKISLECNAVGYKPISVALDLDNLEGAPNAVEILDDTILVNLPLEQLEKGASQALTSVFFFNNSSVMRPNSKETVESLVVFMNNNPDIRIRVHGHTNGSLDGKIIKMGDDSKEYFRVLPKEHEWTNGSAKALSDYRAQSLKKYMVDHGIDSDRIETKGWGGKRLKYYRKKNQANQNFKVEIEIL